jgi:hypothetical protein
MDIVLGWHSFSRVRTKSMLYAERAIFQDRFIYASTEPELSRIYLKCPSWWQILNKRQFWAYLVWSSDFFCFRLYTRRIVWGVYIHGWHSWCCLSSITPRRQHHTCQLHHRRPTWQASRRFGLKPSSSVGPSLDRLSGELEKHRRCSTGGKHNITADIEVIPIQKEAYDRLSRADGKYRFSIDMASLTS